MPGRCPPRARRDIANLYLERIGAQKDPAIYVGDSEIHFIAAQGAGVRVIGPGERVKSPTVIERLHDLPAALERIAGN